MTRVLALVTFKVFPPQMGGQKGVVLFYKHVKGFLNISLAVSKNNEPAPPGWDVVPVLYNNRKIFLNPFVLWRLKKIIQEKKIELIVAEHSYAGWLAYALKKMLQIPFVIHSHNIEAMRFQQMGRRWWKGYALYEKWIHQKADHNFFISAEDEQYALQNFGLPPQKCSVITYGVEEATLPSSSTENLRQSLGLKGFESIFYFNGTLDYGPNYDAVLFLLNRVAPLLQQQLADFTIIITGNRAPEKLVQQLHGHRHFLYLGYVKEIQTLYQLADVFLNPVTNHSGVKTKVIEAIAAGCTVVSTQSGASGLDAKACGEKLHLVQDGDRARFAQRAVQLAQQPKAVTPKTFYDTYLWNNIAQKAAATVSEVARQHAQ